MIHSAKETTKYLSRRDLLIIQSLSNIFHYFITLGSQFRDVTLVQSSPSYIIFA